MDCCAVVTDKLQAEFIYEHVQGANVVAGTIFRSVGIHDYVGFVRSTKEELHVEPACNMVDLVHCFHVSATRGRSFMQNCVKKAWSSLTWCSKPQAGEQSTVHHGGSPWFGVVSQKVDGLAVLSDDSTQMSLALEFLPATFGQPLAKFLAVVLAAWHDGARLGNPSSFFSKFNRAIES